MQLVNCDNKDDQHLVYQSSRNTYLSNSGWFWSARGPENGTFEKNQLWHHSAVYMLFGHHWQHSESHCAHQAKHEGYCVHLHERWVTLLQQMRKKICECRSNYLNWSWLILIIGSIFIWDLCFVHSFIINKIEKVLWLSMMNCLMENHFTDNLIFFLNLSPIKIFSKNLTW